MTYAVVLIHPFVGWDLYNLRLSHTFFFAQTNTAFYQVSIIWIYLPDGTHTIYSSNNSSR